MFCILKWHGEGLAKNVYFIFFWTISLQTFLQELSNGESFVIFGHQAWDLEGGGSNFPHPPTVSWFLITPAGTGLSSSSILELHIQSKVSVHFYRSIWQNLDMHKLH